MTTLWAIDVMLAITPAVKHEPKIMTMTVNQRPSVDCGAMSPNPTVVTVVSTCSD
jgi:hypothetical protein